MSSPLDLPRLLRTHKPEKHLRHRTLRDRSLLRDAATLAARPATRLLLDTNIYVRQLAGTLPEYMNALLTATTLYHCSVALAEIAVGLGNRDPTHPDYGNATRLWRGTFRDLPPGRVLNPDAATWTAAGLVAGTLSRTQNYQPHQKGAFLNDAVIHLTAVRHGIPVLTENHDDFDLLEQHCGGSVFHVFAP